MADFYYQTSISIRAPWLLDTTQLNELDALVANQWSRLIQYRDKKIKHEVDEEFPSAIETTYPKPDKKKDRDAVLDALRERVAESYQNQNKHLRVYLILAGGKKLVANSVKEAIQHAGVADAEVESLSLSLKVADVDVDFEIDTDYNQIKCRVSPETLPESRETFAAIRDWIAKHRPSRWQSGWVELCFLLWTVWFLYAFVSSTILESKSRKAPSQYHTQAVETVKQGVSITNQTKAIELMLALQTGYNPNPAPSKTPKWWLPSVAFGLLACLVFTIKPGSHIGIGKSESRVWLWRKWIHLVTILLPGLLFSSFAWPTLSDLIKSFFK